MTLRHAIARMITAVVSAVLVVAAVVGYSPTSGPYQLAEPRIGGQPRRGHRRLVHHRHRPGRPRAAIVDRADVADAGRAGAQGRRRRGGRGRRRLRHPRQPRQRVRGPDRQGRQTRRRAGGVLRITQRPTRRQADVPGHGRRDVPDRQARRAVGQVPGDRAAVADGQPAGGRAGPCATACATRQSRSARCSSTRSSRGGSSAGPISSAATACIPTTPGMPTWPRRSPR